MYTLMRKLRQRFRRPEPKALILMYHRIAEPACDPWQIAVSPLHFEQHLQQIRQHWNPISLTQLADDVRARRIRDRSVVLTFDDGYLDNFSVARPLLELYQIPATFFITTQNSLQQTPFWWDELQTVILETDQLPDHLAVWIRNELFTSTLYDEATLTPALSARQTNWKWAAAEEAPTQRCRLYYDLWCRLRPLPAPEQQAVLDQLKQWAGLQNSLPGLPVCMSSQHLTLLAANRLFTVGAHTVTHPALADHTDDVCSAEIQASKHFLETQLHVPVDHFAYPYGNYRAGIPTLLSNSAFISAVTTKEGSITRWSELLELPRYQVNDWLASDLQANLNTWYAYQ